MSGGYQTGMPQYEGVHGRGGMQTERPEKIAQMSVDDQREARRQELVARGGIFDAKGNVTQAGRDFLMGNSGWSREQVSHLEGIQQNHAAPIEVIRPAGPAEQSGNQVGKPARSAEALRMAEDARTRAAQELANRARRNAE